MNDERIILKGKRWRHHYEPAIAFFYITLLCWIMPFIMHLPQAFLAMFLFGLFWLVNASAMSYWQYKKLKFKVHLTDKTAKENYAAALSLGNKLGWKVLSSISGESIEFVTSVFTRDFRSMGELVTINFVDGKVLVNSICNPDLKSSFTAWGKNRENYIYIQNALYGRLTSGSS